ncbi:MAG: PQQ-binding-like beta-propeller repeat protein, partial [Acidobacteriota bacterium]|nr:PQQ-binding-like beta-propeller repeat protein [Acidobacteriota bacterium]
YFYYHDYANFYALPEEFVETGTYTIRPWGLSLGVASGAYRQKLQDQAGPRPEDRGFLVAFDPLSGEKIWENRLPSAFNGGVLATTTGVLFHCGGGGDFNAYDKDTGEKIWEFDAYGSFSSSIISYMEGGTQYVATMVGGSTRYDRPGELLVFSLDGEATLHVPPERDYSIPELPPLTADQETIALGNTLYHEHCALCHRGLGQTSIVAAASPDLRRMSPEVHDDFMPIVQDGLLPLGMPGYAELFDEEATTAIHQFVISKAMELRDAQ